MYRDSQFLGLVLCPIISTVLISNIHDDFNMIVFKMYLYVSSTQDQIIISIFEAIIRQTVKSTYT